MSARGLVVVASLALVAAGCYDVGALSRNAAAADGGGGTAGAGGGAWQDLSSPPVTAALRGVFGGDGGDVFAVGASSTILRLGAAASPTVESAPPGFGLRAVWAGGGAAFAVGDAGAVLTRGVSGWDGFSVGDATFYAISPLSPGGPIVVGSGGTVMEQTAGGWAGEDPGVGVQLRGAWSRAGGDVLVVGDGGTIVRGAGGSPPLSWTQEASGVTADLYAVFATATETWIVGTGGVVLHAGSDDAWTAEPSGTTADLYGVFGAGGVVWAVGNGGTIVARRSGAWAVERTGGAALRAVWAATGDAWAVGDGGAILHAH